MVASGNSPMHMNHSLGHNSCENVRRGEPSFGKKLCEEYFNDKRKQIIANSLY